MAQLCLFLKSTQVQLLAPTRQFTIIIIPVPGDVMPSFLASKSTVHAHGKYTCRYIGKHSYM